ncbi:hypothetical protein MTR67_003263 [Solanum verrucosum]|uniref:Uncharacterized protein n=1 Tax=Solanum verrucosum TaxID=315347 RepID=A0AAF0TA76_SOLVR|nr:hypothetical protein MTR67_003263 [Solanum verrucosum]
MGFTLVLDPQASSARHGNCWVQNSRWDWCREPLGLGLGLALRGLSSLSPYLFLHIQSTKHLTVNAISFPFHGSFVYTAGADGLACKIDSMSRNILHKFKASTKAMSYLPISSAFLVDSRIGKAISPLCAHVNYSFASVWHPDGLTFATGNQGKTCSIWDIQNLSKLVTTFKGNLGAIRSICYTSDGRFMGMAELV